MTVEIDIGETTDFFSLNCVKDPSTSKQYVLILMVNTLDFMEENGWEFVRSYIITLSSSTGSQNG